MAATLVLAMATQATAMVLEMMTQLMLVRVSKAPCHAAHTCDTHTNVVGSNIDLLVETTQVYIW